MVKRVNGPDGSRPVAGAGSVKGGPKKTKTAKSNVNMKTTETPEQIKTRNYIETCIETAKALAVPNYAAGETQPTAGQLEYTQRVNNVFKNIDFDQTVINSDGSVKFKFKAPVNVEDFKQAFAFSDGNLRNYLKNRHEQGLKDGTVKINGDEQTLTLYYNEGNGAKVSYSDGYSMTRAKNSNWFTLSPLVDVPDYRNMSLGPDDNEKLILGSSFFRNL